MLIDPRHPPHIFRRQVIAGVTISFLLLVPLAMFGLLVLKGLPEFAKLHLDDVLLWTYSVTWKPALLAGLMLAGVVVFSVVQTPYFHWPYDFGRSFSLGAIAGALTQTFATWLYRLFSHRLFSDIWIAGATIVGCVIGGVVVSVTLWIMSNQGARQTPQKRSAQPK